MSRLIRDKNNGTTTTSDDGETAHLLLPLSSSAVVSHLKACQSLAANHSKEAFHNYLKVLDDALSVEIKNAKTNQEAQELGEVQRQLRQNHADLERYFCGYLAEGFVKFKKRELNTNIGVADEADLENLSLVGNEELEETIAISAITQRAESYFAEPLWALNQRFAVLNGGEHVTESNNPASPIQFCESLRKAIRLIPMDGQVKNLAYKLYDDQLITLMRQISEDLNLYLKQQGILPHLKFTAPQGAAPKSALADDQDSAAPSPQEQVQEAQGRSGQEAELSPEDYQNNLLYAIRGLQNQMLMAGAAGAQAQPGQAGLAPETILQALGALQARTGGTPAVQGENGMVIPVDISMFSQQLAQELEEEGEDGAFDQNSMQTIDLVGMLFEYMLNDENLPDNVKAMLSYLHTPFLKIAFVDPGFFEQAEHPARVLLNSLAEAGARWVGNDGTSQYGIYNKIKDTVDRIVKDFDNDVRIITELLMEFSSYTKNITRRQELMERRATEKAQGEEKLREVKLKVNEEVRSRTEGKELPSAVLLFLLQPWSDYLSFALLRYGDRSEKWQRAITLVDDLLWCIEHEHSDADKTRQKAMIPDITATVENGLETIGYDQAKGKKLLDALVQLIRHALQSKKAEPAPAPMRDKLEKIAAEKAGTKQESKADCTPEEAQMVESLKMIEFGTWFEFEGGKRLKVAWYNARTSHYMLVDQMGKRVDMMSGLNMARQMIKGKAKIISGSSKPFFERALENIYHKLNEQAESKKQEEPDDK